MGIGGGTLEHGPTFAQADFSVKVMRHNEKKVLWKTARREFGNVPSAPNLFDPFRGFMVPEGFFGQRKTTTGPEGREFADADAALKGPLFHGGFCIRIDRAGFCIRIDRASFYIRFDLGSLERRMN